MHALCYTGSCDKIFDPKRFLVEIEIVGIENQGPKQILVGKLLELIVTVVGWSPELKR